MAVFRRPDFSVIFRRPFFSCHFSAAIFLGRRFSAAIFTWSSLQRRGDLLERVRDRLLRVLQRHRFRHLAAVCRDARRHRPIIPEIRRRRRRRHHRLPGGRPGGDRLGRGGGRTLGGGAQRGRGAPVVGVLQDLRGRFDHLDEQTVEVVLHLADVGRVALLTLLLAAHEPDQFLKRTPGAAAGHGAVLVLVFTIIFIFAIPDFSIWRLVEKQKLIRFISDRPVANAHKSPEIEQIFIKLQFSLFSTPNYDRLRKFAEFAEFSLR